VDFLQSNIVLQKTRASGLLAKRLVHRRRRPGTVQDRAVSRTRGMLWGNIRSNSRWCGLR